LKRLKQVQAKLRGGDPLELAEIVRDGARRERRLTANGTNSKCLPISFSAENTQGPRLRAFSEWS